MLGVAVAVVPGRIPLAVAVILQPLEILSKAALVAACVLGLRLMLRFLLRQWGSNPNVPQELRARRQQRYSNLLQAGWRLLNLGGLSVLLVMVISGIPGITALPVSTWLAGGAVIGALAFVFQGLLRDFVAGLVVLLEDHYAVGDWIKVASMKGPHEDTVEDVGILVTTLRCADQRVVVLPNSRCDDLVNHTRIRSGAELLIPLSPAHPQLERILTLVKEECLYFSEDPYWKSILLTESEVRGVSAVSPLAVQLSVLLMTHTGDQWAAKRSLLGRIVQRFEQEGMQLAYQQGLGLDSVNR